MTDFIVREPCEACDRIGHEAETGAGYCKSSPSGECECPPYLKAREYEAIAADVARCLRKETNAYLRREIAEAVADGFSNALWEYDQAHEGEGYGRGAQVSTAAFLEMCGCAHAVAA